MTPPSTEQPAPNDEPFDTVPVSGTSAVMLWVELLLDLPAETSSSDSHRAMGALIAPVAAAAPAGPAVGEEPIDPVPGDLLLLMGPGT